ncbi:hypothetical protein ZOSMA_77G00780 [Zostera marina]|uniref:FIGL1 N-terminal domain-containing protein n=1 Tax=Zostera marina TaxID=29655 RepID=A0A0K9NNS2_ZOSMR|nr:hypothetical protein ZOSMA_77G00780 [Zostera marina]
MATDRDGAEGGGLPGGSWRNEVESNLRRFHSLLFSTDRAIEKSDFASAHVLGVRLLGFLESRIENPVDAAFIDPIHAQVSSKIASCLRSLAPDSDRRAFEQAKREVSDVFVKRGGFDVEKVKKSQRFQQFIGMRSGSSSTVSAMIDCKSLEKLNVPSKLAVQEKMVSAFGDLNRNLIGPACRDHEECTIVSEKKSVSSHNYLKSESINITLQGDEDGRSQVISTKHKRRNIGFTSPVCANVKYSLKKLDGCGAEVAKGFVTAKEKLVLFHLLAFS